MGAIKRGAIAGIVFIVTYLFIFIASFFMKNFDFATRIIVNVILSLVVYTSSIMFFLGFAKVGKKANIKLLKNTSYAFVVFIIIWLVIFMAIAVFGFYLILKNPALFEAKFSPVLNQTANQSVDGFDVNPLSTNFLGLIIGFLIGFIFLLILMVIFMITLIILFGVGLIKLSKEFKIAKMIGIYYIFIGCFIPLIYVISFVKVFVLVLIPIVFLLIPISLLIMIRQIVLLFQAAEKYEGGENIKKKGDLKKRVGNRE